MRPKTLHASELIDIFMKYIVISMDDLIKHTKVTKVTIQRRLKEIGYITTYVSHLKINTNGLRPSDIAISVDCWT
jgi:hypothetical protein